jgi:hypothetical protein
VRPPVVDDEGGRVGDAGGVDLLAFPAGHDGCGGLVARRAQHRHREDDDEHHHDGGHEQQQPPAAAGGHGHEASLS